MTYRNALPAHYQHGPACDYSPAPQPGSVILASTGAYQVNDDGKTEPRVVKFAVETHRETHDEMFATDDPVVFGLPVPAWTAGVLCGAAVWFPILYLLGAF